MTSASSDGGVDAVILDPDPLHGGPDAYEFIKGKPLTLLSGSNLLHLLEAHGHRARIDLKKAKLINKACRHN